MCVCNDVDAWSIDLTRSIHCDISSDLISVSAGYGTNLLEKTPNAPRRSLKELLPEVSEKALSLISNLIVFNPNHRLTAVEALEHPYVAEYVRQTEREREKLIHLSINDVIRFAVFTEEATNRKEVRAWYLCSGTMYSSPSTSTEISFIRWWTRSIASIRICIYIYISIFYRDKRLLLYSLNSMYWYVSTGLSPESGDYRSTSGRKQLVVIVIQLSVKATRLLVKILHTHIKIYVRREVEATHTSPLT